MVARAPPEIRFNRTSGVRPMVSALSANQRAAVGLLSVMARSSRSDAATVTEVDAAILGRRLGVQQAQVAPPAGARILPWLDRRGARIATDAGVTGRVQRVNQQ